jgi:hypothetical protein
MENFLIYLFKEGTFKMNAKRNSEANDGFQPKLAGNTSKKKFVGVISGAALAAAVAFGGGNLFIHPTATFAQTATVTQAPTTTAPSQTASPSTGTSTPQATPSTGTGTTNGKPFGRGGRGGDDGPEGARGGGLSGTISAVSGNTITLKRGDVVVIQATVNASTVYTKAGKTITLADLVAGDVANVRTTTATDGTISITQVEVVLDRTSGTISAIDATSMTLTKRDNSTIKVSLGSSVSVQDLGKAANLSDLKAGVSVEVAGKLNTDGTFSAQVINVQHDRLGGTVTAISGNTITVTAGGKGQEGRGPGKAPGNTGTTPSTGSTATPAAGSTAPVTTTKTITVSGTTTYLSGGQAIQLSGIAVGDRIEAVGTASTDGNSLTALQVSVQLPRYQGQVTSVNGSTIVIQDRGTSRTVEVNSSTQYLNGQATAALSDVKAGVNISVEGKVDASGKMTASVVQLGRSAGSEGRGGGKR